MLGAKRPHRFARFEQSVSQRWRLQNHVNFLIRQAELAEYHQTILWAQFALTGALSMIPPTTRR